MGIIQSLYEMHLQFGGSPDPIAEALFASAIAANEYGLEVGHRADHPSVRSVALTDKFSHRHLLVLGFDSFTRQLQRALS